MKILKKIALLLLSSNLIFANPQEDSHAKNKKSKLQKACFHTLAIGASLYAAIDMGSKDVSSICKNRPIWVKAGVLVPLTTVLFIGGCAGFYKSEIFKEEKEQEKYSS